MKKFVLAPVLAALAMFFWGFLYWSAPPLLPYKTLATVADESATALAIGKLFPSSGAYLIPSPLSGEEKMLELAKRGPSVEVHIRKESVPAMDPTVLLKGYAQMLVIAALLTGLLCRLEKSFERWTCRVKFCAAIGLLVALGDLGQAIWWHHAWGWTLAAAVFDLVMFTIAGLVIAKFVTPKPAAAETA
jgi:hypothetical protein